MAPSPLPPWLAPSGASAAPSRPAGSSCRQWWPAGAFGQPASVRGGSVMGQRQTDRTQGEQSGLPEDEESLETLTALCIQAEDGQQATVKSTVELAAPMKAPFCSTDGVLERTDTQDSACTASLLPILEARDSGDPPKQLLPLPEEPGGPKAHCAGSVVGKGAGVCVGKGAVTADATALAAGDEDVDDIPLVSKHPNAFLDIMRGRSPLNNAEVGSPVRVVNTQHGLPFLLSSLSAANCGCTVFSPKALLGATASDSPGGSFEPWGLAASSVSDASVPSVRTAASSSSSASSGIASLAAAPPAYSRMALCCPPAAPVIAPRLLYVGVFLTPESQEVLLSMVPAVHPLLRGEHMTLVYRPSVAQLLQYPLGVEVDVRVLGSAVDSRVQAVFVEAPSWLETTSACAHVTISVAMGAKAVEAGTLLQEALQQATLASTADLAYAPTAPGAYQHFTEPLPLLGRLGVRLAVPTATAVSMGWADEGTVSGPEVEVVVYSVDEVVRSGCFSFDSSALEGYYQQFGHMLGKQDPCFSTLPQVEANLCDTVSTGSATPDANAQLPSPSIVPASSNSPGLPAVFSQASSPLDITAYTANNSAAAGVAAGSTGNSPPPGYCFGASAAASPPTGGLAALLAGSGSSTPLPASPPSGGGLAALLSADRRSSAEVQSRPVSAGGGLAALLSAAAASAGSSSSPALPAAADSGVTPVALFTTDAPAAAADLSVSAPAGLTTPAAASPAAECVEEAPDSPRSTSSGSSGSSGSSMDAVQFLSAVRVGDYVAVRPFVPTEGNERLLQGYVREFAADEPFQAEGVLVVLSDNTIGYVTAVIDSEARNNSPGSSSKQAPSKKGTGKAGKARKASKAPSSNSTAVVDGPARASMHSSSSLDPLQQWMLDAEAAAAPVVLEPVPRRRDKRTAQRDMQLWREFEALQQQYGETLCNTILGSCGHDFAEAIELIKGQSSGLSVAGASGSRPSSPARASASRPAAVPVTPATPAPFATAADEGMVSQLALSLGLLPNDALQLARIVPDLPAETVVQALQTHNGDVGAAADALLNSQAQEVASPAASSTGSDAGSSRAAAGCGMAAGLDRHVAQAFISGKDPARVAAARQLTEMAPGLSIELAVLLLEEHNGNLHEAAQALSDMQEREVIARSATAADTNTAVQHSLADMQGLTEEDQMAMLTAMGILEAETQQAPQSQQQQKAVSRPQPTHLQRQLSPVRAKPVVSTSPPKQQHTPVHGAAGPSHFGNGGRYAVAPPPPPQRAALAQDFANLEAQRAAAAQAKATTDELYRTAANCNKHADIMFTAAQDKLNEGDRASYDEFRAQGLELRRQARTALEEAQRIAWSANNSNRTNTWDVDLHGLSVTKAVAKFASQFTCLRGMDHPGGVVMRVITGKGLHSEGNIPKIKLGIQQFLKEQADAEQESSGEPWGVTWGEDPVNQGIINVHIPAGCAGAEA